MRDKQSNDVPVAPVRIDNLAGLHALSPDGHQLEIRVHAVQSGGGVDHSIVIGEIIFRSFRGGFQALQHLLNEGPKVAQALLVQATSNIVIPMK